jgi:hypothetical protein
MRELVRGKNTIGPEVIDPGGRSVEKPSEVSLNLGDRISGFLPRYEHEKI